MFQRWHQIWEKTTPMPCLDCTYSRERMLIVPSREKEKSHLWISSTKNHTTTQHSNGWEINETYQRMSLRVLSDSPAKCMATRWSSIDSIRFSHDTQDGRRRQNNKPVIEDWPFRMSTLPTLSDPTYSTGELSCCPVETISYPSDWTSPTYRPWMMIFLKPCGQMALFFIIVW